ncbi:uncharacterized protein LOC103716621 [Phoenix dactylifera]|uniref:Uncharacterized protein LOC103716621 n=1 Tax=Phoenix dactylifera TaxID=42345 RepID=A0A8B8J9G4_PHODC|nr:uncharacterized protein LOC103716621 [Phoenix dactylifera]XP_026664072.2 uncharacterized protein LOC103716621 [Phoenix dactylifera]XP_026664073.2 uncharacterized protein LOC103716621 [Phoenix dactylifera]XP_038989865.1 uncharacterized protein LOC103716621 [Phoenix dactylifera]XP_038989878.1 uncharacterized protein LOC103716621 [Phoenix dactylifera]
MASADEESLSPKNRLKLLCSYGGRILPRPSDGQLKYVGGETRVLAVPRSISFSELKKRIQEMFNSAKVVIKYQIMPEDLDALVSVTCDEDLRHMLHEYDRHEPRSPSNSPRFRLFLFSTAPPPLAPLSDAAASPIEQRYVEAINGVPPTATPATSTLSLFNISSSAATSPTSTIDLRDAFRPSRSNLLSTAAAAGLHRVRSTPNLGTAKNLSQMASGAGLQLYGGHQQDHHRRHHHHHHTTASRSRRRRTAAAEEGCGGWGVGPCGTRCVDADAGAG